MAYLFLLITISLLIQLIHAIPNSSQGQCSGQANIKAIGELDSIKNCQSFDGSIMISNLTNTDTLKLPQLQSVHGNLIISGNQDLALISLGSLQQVDGQLKLENNRELTKLDLSSLTSAQSLEISVHPSLGTIEFPAGLSQLGSLTITDTMAAKIDGLKMTKLKDVSIANNLYMKELTLNTVEQIDGLLSVSANSASLNLDLSSLSTISQGEIRNVATLDMDKVTEVSGGLSFISNSFTTVSLSNCSTILGTLTVANNLQLTNMSVPVLQHVGGAYALSNNTQWTEISAPKLQQIDGTVDITGAFEKLDLSGLTDVRGGFNIQTSSTSFSCDEINKFKQGVTKGHEFTCKSDVSHPQPGISINGTQPANTTTGGTKSNTVTGGESTSGSGTHNPSTYFTLSIVFFLLHQLQ
ncbi:hypothetical protein BDB01DRAFT_760802 [Pilobolus umbonatus]|nr:hypothetical protein BDB01DRAFT_760802 [Pilobolus umbonatus]